MKKWSERFLAAVVISALFLIFYAIWFDFPNGAGEKLLYQWWLLFGIGAVWVAFDHIMEI